MPDYKPQMNAAVQAAIQPDPAPSHHGGGLNHILPYLVYVLQAADAVNSANKFKQYGMHETTPQLMPFSHGGAPTMALGFGLEDLLRHHLLKHASQGTKNTAEILTGLDSLRGINQTNARARTIDSQHLPGMSLPIPPNTKGTP